MFGLRNDCNLLVTEKKRLHQGYCSIHYLEKNILKLYYPYKDFFYKYIETHKIRKTNLIRKWHILAIIVDPLNQAVVAKRY